MELSLRICGAAVSAVIVWLTVRFVNGRKPSRRTILQAIFGAAVVAAAWGLLFHRAHRQNMEAIALVERLGGSVSADNTAPEWLLRLQTDDKLWGDDGIGPNGLREWLHADLIVDHFHEVKVVWVDEGPGMRLISNHSGQRRDVSNIRATDEDLVQISNLTNVDRLYLRHMPITDEGIRHLRKMPRLRHLYLSYTQITDASADILAELKELEILRVAGTRITDTGVAKLQSLPHLEELNVESTGVTEAGVKPFRERSGFNLFWDDPANPLSRGFFE